MGTFSQAVMLECLFGVLLFEVERWIKLGTS